MMCLNRRTYFFLRFKVRMIGENDIFAVVDQRNMEMTGGVRGKLSGQKIFRH